MQRELPELNAHDTLLFLGDRNQTVRRVVVGTPLVVMYNRYPSLISMVDGGTPPVVMCTDGGRGTNATFEATTLSGVAPAFIFL